MYRLSMAKGKRSKEEMHVKLEFDLYLSREELAALKKDVDIHNAVSRKYGWKPDWDERNSLLAGVLRHIDKLKEQYGEDKYVESSGDSDEDLPITAEIRGGEECRQVV